MDKDLPPVTDLGVVREVKALGVEAKRLVELQVAIEGLLAGGNSPEDIKRMVDDLGQQSGRITKG